MDVLNTPLALLMKMVFAEKVAYIRIKAFPILQYKIDTPVLTRATEVIDPTRQ